MALGSALVLNRANRIAVRHHSVALRKHRRGYFVGRLIVGRICFRGGHNGT